MLITLAYNKITVTTQYLMQPTKAVTSQTIVIVSLQNLEQRPSLQFQCLPDGSLVSY